MFSATNFTDYLQYLATHDPAPFALEDIPGFPYEEYQKLQTKYREAESWYSGDILDEEIDSIGGNPVDRYPIKINPIKGTVLKHVKTLFGEVNVDDKPLVFPRVVAVTDADKEIAKEAEDILLQSWWESNGRAIQSLAGFHSQIYGGCVFRLSYDFPPSMSKAIPITLEVIHPKCFIAKPDSRDFFRLKEAWIIKAITTEEARENGVDTASDEGILWLVEKYTETEYWATINGEPVKKLVGGTWLDISGPNPYGFIPIVYIPAIRSWDFYGETFIDSVKGLVLEYNRRFADYGDAVSVDSHSYLGMRNVNGAPTVQQVAPGLYVVNVGSNPNISGHESDPDIFELRKPSASAPMGDLIEQLYAQYRRDAFLPKISDGEDEGSQRSGLTLAMRMWPLITYTDAQRVNWTAGLDLIDRYILRILYTKGFGRVNKKHLVMRIRQEWAPVLPRDREAEINEAATRVAAKLGSPQTMMSKLGDIDDPEAEVKLMLAFEKQLSKTRATPVPGAVGEKPGGGTKPPGTLSEKPQKESNNEPR